MTACCFRLLCAPCSAHVGTTTATRHCLECQAPMVLLPWRARGPSFVRAASNVPAPARGPARQGWTAPTAADVRARLDALSATLLRRRDGLVRSLRSAGVASRMASVDAAALALRAHASRIPCRSVGPPRGSHGVRLVALNLASVDAARLQRLGSLF